MDQIIEQNPIGEGLNSFCTSFGMTCKEHGISGTPESLEQLSRNELQYMSLNLLAALQFLPTARLLHSKSGSTLFTEISHLNSIVTSDDFDFDRFKPIIIAIVTRKPDIEIWSRLRSAIVETTPPPQPTALAVLQTPLNVNANSSVNSSEHRKYMDNVLKDELRFLYAGVDNFHETYFGEVVDLKRASDVVFEKCMRGSDPLFHEGWTGWPEDADQDRVLDWFEEVIEKFTEFSEGFRPKQTSRSLLAEPNRPIEGSVAERKLDIALVSNIDAENNGKYHWSQILVPGELKSNPSADTAAKAWLDLGRYAKEVLTTQDTRRFVIGFTLCGSLMRIWVFDRLGGIASDRFDINEDGLQFVSTILGFLWMDDAQLGFDPTIITVDGEKCIDIERDGHIERLVIDQLMKRASCIAGRATTCWKAHRSDDPQTPLVIKDSWQYTEREEEGELLQKVTNASVTNVARYYHHETVQVLGMDDDIQGNVRKGLDVTTAENYPSIGPIVNSDTPPTSSRTTGRKRSATQNGMSGPPRKRIALSSPTEGSRRPMPNRVHRRVVLRDYGKAIYKATSPISLLAALEGCISGHQSLLNAGILHRDISINNIMIKECEEDSIWPSFLIDLDLAVETSREGPSGARGRTGTKAFMAIGTLLGEDHSFMHDLESFFWVLFWICIHYGEPGQSRSVPRFDEWNYADMEALAAEKMGVLVDEQHFRKLMAENFTEHYRSLIPCMIKLSRAVFPNHVRWKQEKVALYSEMRYILRDAQERLSSQQRKEGSSV